MILLAALICAIAWAAFNRDRLDPSSIDAGLAAMGIWAPIAYMGLYIAGTVIFVPGSLFALAGGALFGPVWGSLLNLVAATIGASFAFLIARYLAGDWVARKTGGKLKRLIDGVEAEGWRFVAFVRLVPLFPFNLTNYAIGLTRIGFWTYAATSFVCMAPGALAYTWLGYAGREAVAGNASAIRYGLLALGLLAAIGFLPRLVRRMRGNRVTWIEPGDLRSLLDSGRPVTIIDVRGDDEFAGPLGHIPGSVNVPLADIGRGNGALSRNPDGAIVFVCRTDKRSAAAAELVHDSRAADVRVLRGGMERWNALGFNIDRKVR